MQYPTLLVSLLISSAAALPAVLDRRACDTGVRIFVARGSTEAPGTGSIGPVATSIASKVAGSSIVAVDYPATLIPYGLSVASGVTALTKLLTDYNTACPSSKIVVVGYSQGAQVIGDTICGSTSNAAIAAKYQQNIVSIIQMGDPTHVQGLTGNVGTSTRNGVFPRANAAACTARLVGKTQAYCDANDTFCDPGSSLVVHGSYVTKYGAQAATFAASKA